MGGNGRSQPERELVSRLIAFQFARYISYPNVSSYRALVIYWTSGIGASDSLVGIEKSNTS